MTDRLVSLKDLAAALRRKATSLPIEERMLSEFCTRLADELESLV